MEKGIPKPDFHPEESAAESSFEDRLKKETSTSITYLIASYYAGQEVLRRLESFRSKICEYLVSNQTAEQKISAIRTILLERRIEPKDPIPKPGEHEKEFLKMMENHPFLVLEYVNDLTGKIRSIKALFDEVAEVIRSGDAGSKTSSEGANILVARISNLMI